MLYLYTKVDELPDRFIGDCLGVLPKWRAAQMLGYQRTLDQKLCAAAYLLLIHALKQEGLFCGIPQFQYGDSPECDHRSGLKPSLSNYPGVHFNLSHCEAAVACALASVPVGIDIERVGDYDDDLARVLCNDEEYRNLSTLSHGREALLTEIWARKESVVKLSGRGLQDDLRTIHTGNCSVFRRQVGENLYIISSITES